MHRSLRPFIYLSLLLFPALALANPPRIYHHVDQLAAHAGGTVRLTLSSQDLLVTVKPGKKVSVTTDIWSAATSADKKKQIIKRYTPEVKADGNDIRIDSEAHSGWHWFSWGNEVRTRVTVVMPADMHLNYRLGSGDFRFDNPSAKLDVKGESGSGDVFFKGTPKWFKVSAGSGDMHVATGEGSGTVSAHTGSGDIDFKGAATELSLGAGSGDITAREATAHSADLGSGSGDIEVHWKKLTAGASIKGGTGSGDVDMYFPASTVIGGKLSTGSGDVDTDFPATIHGSRHSYTLGGGSGAITVNIDTGSGDIGLHKGD